MYMYIYKYSRNEFSYRGWSTIIDFSNRSENHGPTTFPMRYFDRFFFLIIMYEYNLCGSAKMKR